MPDPHDSDLLLRNWLRALPKAELHVHVEGTLEPEMMFRFAQRNGVALPYADAGAVRTAYRFTDLQSFLDLYYAGAAVLQTERDFRELAVAYLRRARADGIVHTEIMFDPQTHTHRGVALQTVFAGLAGALREARETLGISGYLLMSFLRDHSEADAIATLQAALPLRDAYRDVWIGVGLDSAERGNPPEKFAGIYQHCAALGLRLVAHAGEEGPASYVRDALQSLGAERIDHGVHAMDDSRLMTEITRRGIPLTVCPLSNLRLGVVRDLRHHCLGRQLRAGAMVTLNSDDPAYFGGYLLDNYVAAAHALDLSRDELTTLAANSIEASFLPQSDKDRLLGRSPRAATPET